MALFVGACVFNQEHPYPDSWPSLEREVGVGCRDLEGSYADRGATETFPATNPSLSFNLGWGPHQREGWPPVQRVTLSLPSAESLEAVVLGADGERIAARVLTRASGEFVCESGRATIRWHIYEAEDIATAREDYTVELGLAGNYLVTHVRDRAIGSVFLVFPVWGTTRSWARFERLAQ